MSTVVKNYIIRNGRKLFGAVKDKVLLSEKAGKRKRKPVPKKKPGRKRNVFGLMEASQALQLLDQVRRKNDGSKPAIRINGTRTLTGSRAIGYIRRNPSRMKNIEMGFHSGGSFHPIRSSIDYSPAAVGESFHHAPTSRSAKRLMAKRRAGNSPKTLKKNSPVLVLVNGRKSVKKRATRKHRRNQEDGLFEKFHGYDSTEDVPINRPNSAPAKLDCLGTLDCLFYRSDLEHVSTSGNQKGKTKSYLDLEHITGPKLFLASNKEGNRYYIVSKGDLRMFEPNKIFGPLTRVEYTAKKPHLNKGSMRDQGYWHALGEEDGNRPVLKTDGEGCLIISGGNYRTEPDGIAN